MTATLVRKERAIQIRIDAEMGRSESFPRWSGDVYGDRMPQRGGKPRPTTPLMKYLKGIQDRPGWSIARVARESGGRFSRATLFRIMTGETKRVSVDTVRLVAQIAGDDPDEVLAIASGSLTELSDRDPRLAGLDPNSPAVRHIMSIEDIDEETRGFMLDRQREIEAFRAQQDIAEIDLMVKREREREQRTEDGGARKAS